jgi:hypothetical protein
MRGGGDGILGDDVRPLDSRSQGVPLGLATDPQRDRHGDHHECDQPDQEESDDGDAHFGALDGGVLVVAGRADRRIRGLQRPPNPRARHVSVPRRVRVG